MPILFSSKTPGFDWLSNFSEHPIVMSGDTWPTVEHFYQASKFEARETRDLIMAAPTARRAKEIANDLTVNVRADWLDVRVTVMYGALQAKFEQHPSLRELLLSTGDSELIHESKDDLFWARLPSGAGRNTLGNLLMRLRSELKEDYLPMTQTLDANHDVPGLVIVESFISPTDEMNLLSDIDARVWGTELSRRTQHYGRRYDYKARSTSATDPIEPLPPMLQLLANRLHMEGHMSEPPQQCIVNEYTPGQGIADHVDRLTDFGPTVVSLSLGSACVMKLTPLASGAAAVEILLQPRSLLVLGGAARSHWKHGIAKRKRDVFQGAVIERKRRVSLTFRTLR